MLRNILTLRMSVRMCDCGQPKSSTTLPSCVCSRLCRLTFLQAHHELFQPLPQLRILRHSPLSRTRSCFNRSA